MIPISFTVADCFKLVRSLVRDEAHRLRQRSDPFGEELALTPESRLDQPPLSLTPTEIVAASRRVAVFFTDALRHEDLADLPTFGEWAALVCERWGNNPDQVTLFTSGSMGNPKAILRELYFLAQDARFVIETFEEYGHAVRQTADGGYIVGGSTLSAGAGQADFYLVRTDPNGDTLWTRAYGGGFPCGPRPGP
jgi:acyl-coenzyme A synthetase/AMP-(fatty) acid ligase